MKMSTFYLLKDHLTIWPNNLPIIGECSSREEEIHKENELLEAFSNWSIGKYHTIKMLEQLNKD